jgi:regulator of protease activity HflC (stomatin/prohibitin superfamily)
MIGVAVAVVLLLVFGAIRAVVVVPGSSAYITERLGRYRGTLPPGFHLIVPIVDRIAFKHLLTLQTGELTDVYETDDRRRATLATTFRFRVLDAQRASYGAADF